MSFLMENWQNSELAAIRMGLAKVGEYCEEK